MELTPEQIEQLQELLNKSKGENTALTPSTAQPVIGYTIKVGGQAYTVNSNDEAQRLFDQYEAQKNQEVEAQRVQAEALRQRQEQAEQELPKAGASDDNFDREEYARLFLSDPRKAQRYMLQHDPEQLQFFQGLVGQLNQVKQEQAASAFLLQHKDDYVPTKQNFQALENIISENNLGWDLRGMNVAFQLAKAQGALEVGSGRNTQLEEVPDVETEEAFVRVPRVQRRRSTQSNEDASQMLQKFESLTPEAQKAYLESLTQR